MQTITQEPIDGDQLQLLVLCLHTIFLHDLTSPLFSGTLSQEYG